MKKALITFAFCFLVANATIHQVVDLLTNGYEEVRHDFFGRHYIRKHEGGSHRVVHFPEGGMFSKIEHLREYNDRFIDSMRNPEKYRPSEEDIIQCEPGIEPAFYKFFAHYMGDLREDGQTINFVGHCFQNNTLTLSIKGENTIEITHIMENKKSEACSEGYLYSSLANSHMEGFFEGGTHTITFDDLTDDDMDTIHTVGMMIFRGCDSVLNFYPDIMKTTFLFSGGLGEDPYIPVFGSKVTPEQVKENVRFTKEAMGYEYKMRPEKAREVVYSIPHELVQSGDFFLNVRMDGLNQMTQYGSGTHAGHSVMALWVDGELYIVESNAAWYWPRVGLQINPFDDWMKWAHNADYHTVWLPLKKEVAANFNETAAYEFFKSVEGMPYGYHNFLFGWIDTVDKSFPPVLSPELLAAVLAIYEIKHPDATLKIFNAPLQMRLNLTDRNYTIPEIARIAYSRGMEIQDLYPIVEEDGWFYYDGFSWVCSAFVARMWKAAGLFGDLEINAPEFTPRDIYETSFIDPAPPVPASCKELDPENPFCQVMGEYRLEFPRISSIEPYSHMNEHCSSQPPEYLRLPEGC